MWQMGTPIVLFIHGIKIDENSYNNIDHTKYYKTIGINKAIVKTYKWGPVSVAT